MASPYLKAALFTLSLTLLGFFLISQLDAMRSKEIRDSIDEIVNLAESERLLFMYSQTMDNSSKDLCSYSSKVAERRAAKAYELMLKVQSYEQSSVLDSEYYKIKEKYYLANMGLYLNMQAMKKFCGHSPYRFILFFYKIKEDCPECRAQGLVLDSLRKKYPNLRIFAFPADTDYEFINVLTSRYNIETVPSLVVDDQFVLRGLQDEAAIDKYLRAVSG
ncbi:MAG: thioredoxin family protein [Candidatus Micrarchaeota archaeon]|nr:thioredoxin family protein [Candidatus Micrarchaeota archaeon]